MITRTLPELLKRRIFKLERPGLFMQTHFKKNFTTSFPGNNGRDYNKKSRWNLNADMVTLTLVGTASLIVFGAEKFFRSEKMKAKKEFTKNLKLTVIEMFGSDQMPPEIVEQLWHLQVSQIKTSESNVRLANKPQSKLHIEVLRSLVRWKCFMLLLDGSEQAYLTFTSHQLGTDKLTPPSFQILSQFMRLLSPAARHAIEISCFLAISETAKDSAAGRNIKFSPDSEKFMTDTITQCMDIYPAVSLLNQAEKNLLPFLYLKDSHVRHIIYTEGGNNMFAELDRKLRQSDFTVDQFQVWLGRWIINIAGFRGHENPNGSIYLTENMAQALFGLNNELRKFEKDANYDVLKGYLEIRAKQLGVTSLYLAHLGASMRLYTREQGSELQNWFNGLPQFEREEYEKGYEKLRSELRVTPTFQVAVMDNLLALGCSIAETLNIQAKISRAAELSYREGILAGRIDAETPLCFREIAFKETLQPIVDAYRLNGEMPAMVVDGDGKVSAGVMDFSSSLKPGFWR